MLNKILNGNIKSGNFLEIYREGYSRDEIYSKILAVGEYVVAVAMLDHDGLFDGIAFLKKADISRICKGGNELESIEQLFSRQEQGLPVWNHPLNDLSLWDIVTHYLKDDLLTIYTEYLNRDIFFIGRCVEHDNKWIKFYAYGTCDSCDCSELFFQIKDITRVDIFSRYSKSIETIFASKDRKSSRKNR